MPRSDQEAPLWRLRLDMPLIVRLSRTIVPYCLVSMSLVLCNQSRLLSTTARWALASLAFLASLLAEDVLLLDKALFSLRTLARAARRGRGAIRTLPSDRVSVFLRPASMPTLALGTSLMDGSAPSVDRDTNHLLAL